MEWKSQFYRQPSDYFLLSPVVYSNSKMVFNEQRASSLLTVWFHGYNVLWIKFYNLKWATLKTDKSKDTPGCHWEHFDTSSPDTDISVHVHTHRSPRSEKKQTGQILASVEHSQGRGVTGSFLKSWWRNQRFPELLWRIYARVIWKYKEINYAISSCHLLQIRIQRFCV